MCEALAPFCEVDLLDATSELHIDATLSHTRATHAGEVRLAANLEREAAVHEMIPTVPLKKPRRVHRADEIAHAERRADEDLVSARVGNGDVGQLVHDAIMAVEQFGFIQ